MMIDYVFPKSQQRDDLRVTPRNSGRLARLQSRYAGIQSGNLSPFRPDRKEIRTNRQKHSGSSIRCDGSKQQQNFLEHWVGGWNRSDEFSNNNYSHSFTDDHRCQNRRYFFASSLIATAETTTFTEQGKKLLRIEGGGEVLRKAPINVLVGLVAGSVLAIAILFLPAVTKVSYTLSPIIFEPSGIVQVPVSTDSSGRTQIASADDAGGGSEDGEPRMSEGERQAIAEAREALPEHAKYVDDRGNFDTRACAKDLYASGEYSAPDAVSRANEMRVEWKEMFNEKASKIA